MELLVIGCGVSGLTTGLRLLEAGHTVTIWASARPPHTTSNIAAAVWYPYKAYPEDRVTAWGAVAYQRFKALSADAQTGVRMAHALEALGEPSGDPWWVSAVEGFRHAGRDELPAGYVDGYVLDAPVIDTGIYLDYLVRAFEGHGGRIVERTVSDLSEAFAVATTVVNCAGLGARELVGDHDLHPSRGQVIRLKANGFRQVVMDDTGPNAVAYVVPRVNDIVLGGTDDEGNWSTEPDPEVTAGILKRTAALVPWVARLTPDDILNVVCGLRPVRSTVRVEAERLAPERTLIHNYGHGGAGITLSWGCADEVVGLVGS
ncbi:MAG TPA: FAD-dependent oxidoreductase [Ktedonobacterales bacterium]|jgi:D-amino-acid oxidase|nr:FAD-dependent oxidoreductase [Ktedonobacterales bacterium]